MIATADAPPSPTPVVVGVPSKGRTIAELLETVSGTRLQTWLSCRLKFYFQYVLGLKKPKTPALHVGRVIHAVLQVWNKARWKQQPMDEAAITAEFNRAWKSEEKINWDGEEEAKRANTLECIKMYLRDTPIPSNEKPLAVEVSVEMSLAHYGLPTLVGILDLVRARRQIVDFKSASQTPNPETVLHNHAVQTTGYAMLFREATGTMETAIELHSIVKNKTPKLVVTTAPPANDAQITRFLRIAESYVSGLQREDFVPSAGMACMGCQFLGECRKWS